jgi:hypothetical protein
MGVENVMDVTLRPIYELYGRTRECYFFRSAARGFAEIIDCFRPKRNSASIQTPALHLVHDLFTKQSAILYTFQHSLTITKVSSRLATKTADIMAIFYNLNVVMRLVERMME